MTILLSDPRVAAVPVLECGEPLVALDADLSPTRQQVRAGLAGRLARAAASLPDDVGLRVVEGHRSLVDQRAIIADYATELRRLHPGVTEAELAVLTSRFVAPVGVAPHLAGAAVDLTLVDRDGVELDLGTPVDATPEQSCGRCYLDSPDVGATARAHRRLLVTALGGAGLVNYPTEWWHWSHGDRYWALLTGAPHALYGPVAAAATVTA